MKSQAVLISFSEVIATVRMDVTAVAEELSAVRQEVAEIAKAVADIAKVNRRIESKVNGISTELAEIKGTPHNHEVRLEALNS